VHAGGVRGSRPALRGEPGRGFGHRQDDRGHLEDRACADYLEALLDGGQADLEVLLEPLRSSDRYREFQADRWPGFPPSDLELALVADRFGFSMPVSRDELGLRVRRNGL
jgi:2-phosphosulfolactate phosphatase